MWRLDICISKPFSGRKKLKNHHTFTKLLLSASVLAMASNAVAQDSDPDEVIATGIRQSLENALVEKREADSLVEIINAEDIGKLPDQNLAEVLENIPGIQITRTEGVGTGVQIRGTDDNIILFNGVATVGSGNARGGINFTDVNPSIIAGLEVIKAPTADTIEGAVGGTVNLRTIRPLDLKDTLASVRIQGEDSSLTEGIEPRISGALGNKWENAKGQEIGVVVAGSYTQSENTAFRPRLDRDNYTDCTGDTPPTTCPAGAPGFLGVQFLNQVQRTQEFETFNIAGSIEAKPTENLKLYGDVIYTDQTRDLSGSRVQASTVSRINGTGAFNNSGNANFTAFDTFDIGSATGENGVQDFGSILAVTQGTFTPLGEEFGAAGRGAPFLRSANDTGSRLTESTTVILGSEWEATEALTLGAEYARSSSETENPNLGINLNFINPNTFIALRSDTNGSPDLRDENGTPFIFDLTDGFGWDINFADPLAPSEAELLTASNYIIDGNPSYSRDRQENVEEAWRFDGSYDFSETGLSDFITSVDLGARFATRTSLRDERDAAIRGNGGVFQRSVNASGFSQLLGEIPDNFAEGTGNSLAVDGLLYVDPGLTRNHEEAIRAVNAAAAAQGLPAVFGTVLESNEAAFFDIEEETTSIYGQVNFDFGRVRGNAGMRYVDTSLESTANVFDSNGDAALTTVESGYDHYLPRFNVAVDVTDDIVLRGAYYEDINRPDFTEITSARTFPPFGGVNGISIGGNPFLVPEEVESFDASIDWYFAPEAVFSVGVFRKERNGLFGQVDDPAEEIIVNGLPTRDTTAPCEGGGIFSPGTESGIFGNGEVGVCVANRSTFNSDNSTTQEGIEFALQYNLAGWEDRLGWASGFGMTANYTYQTEDNNTGFLPVTNGRANTIYAAQGVTNVTREASTLLNLSNHAYNLTGYYEKYGLTARLRWTWRDAFATNDLPGTSGVFTPFGFRGIVEPRGQLNGSVSYDINDNFTVNVDAVNLTESDADVSCVSDGGLPCYQVITDRRIIFGGSYTF